MKNIIAPNKLTLGRHYEQIAIDYITSKDIKLLTKNFYSKNGEIDLIFLNAKYICFTEVRYRNTLIYGRPEETVNYYKQKKIIHTANYYLLINPQLASIYQPRFDIVAISGNLSQYDIQWYQDAF